MKEKELTAPDPSKVQAAQHILNRLNPGEPIFEDWTWNGAPYSVGQWNDTLLAEAEEAGLTR